MRVYRYRNALVLAALVLVTAGCRGETDLERLRQEMYDQPRYEPLEASAFFEDGLSARPPVAGTVARGQLRTDPLLYTGKGEDGTLSAEFPYPVTPAMIARGRDRFNIYCSPCHDYAGTGKGMVVQRGFKQPTSFHIDRLREAPPGHFFDVMTQGFGAMYSYASRVPARDRWAIAAYIRALQLSQNGRLEDVPSEEKARLIQAD